MIDINKFEDIKDLPISEEMLGAYLEGNLHGSEFREVQNFIHDNAYVSDLVDTVDDNLDIIRDLGLSYQEGFDDMICKEDLFSEISLPKISAFDMDSLINSSPLLTNDIILGNECHNFIGDDDSSLHSAYQDTHHHDTEINFGITDNIE